MVDDRPDDFDIEEYRADLRYWVHWMLGEHFADIPVDNHHWEGRVRFELERVMMNLNDWPIPTPRKYWNAIGYLVGSGDLNHIPCFDEGASYLHGLFSGVGLTKVRHHLRLAELAIEAIELIESQAPRPLSSQAKLLIQELKKAARGFYHGQLKLPQALDDWPRIRREIQHVDADSRVEEEIPELWDLLEVFFVAIFFLTRPSITKVQRQSWPEWLFSKTIDDEERATEV